MKQYKFIFTLLIIFLYSCAGHSQKVDQNYKLANEIYESSEVKEYFQYIDSRIERNINSVKDSLTDNQLSLVNEGFKETLEYSHLKKSATKNIAKSFNPDSAKLVLTLLKKPSIQRIHNLVSANLEVGQEVIDYGKNFDTSEGNNKTRVQIVNKIGNLTYSTEIILDAALNTAKIINFTNNQLKSENERLTLSEMNKRINAPREELVEATKPGVLVQLLYNFREESVEDLKSYLSFLERPIGSWYVNLIYISYSRILEDSSQNYIEILNNINK